MFNPRTKFEMSTITCNEEMKGNAKCKKILILSHPLGDLGVTHKVYRWLDGKRVVDFLLAIIELFSLALTGSGTIKRNPSKSAFSNAGIGHFERKV